MLLPPGNPDRGMPLEVFTQHRLTMDAVLQNFIVINEAHRVRAPKEI